MKNPVRESFDKIGWCCCPDFREPFYLKSDIERWLSQFDNHVLIPRGKYSKSLAFARAEGYAAGVADCGKGLPTRAEAEAKLADWDIRHHEGKNAAEMTASETEGPTIDWLALSKTHAIMGAYHLLRNYHAQIAPFLEAARPTAKLRRK